MEDIKSIWKSRTLWGAFAALLCSMLAAFGYTISDATESQIANVGVALGGAIGSIIAIYGRIKATKTINTKTKSGNGKKVAALIPVLLLPVILQACALSSLPSYERGLAVGQELKVGYETLHQEYQTLHASENMPLEGIAFMETKVAPIMDATKRAIIAYRSAAITYARTKIEPENWTKLGTNAATLFEDCTALVKQAHTYMGGDE